MIKYFYVHGADLFRARRTSHDNILFPSYDACSHNKTAMYDIMIPHQDDVHIIQRQWFAYELVKPMPRP